MKYLTGKYLLVIFLLHSITGAYAQRITTDPDFKGYFNEATKNFLFGKYVQAVNLYKECLRIQPKSSTTHYQLSKVYLSAGNLELSGKHAKIAVELDSSNKWYIQSLGDIYQMEGKTDSAILTYEKLLALDKDNVNILFGIAALYEKVGKFEQAVEYLNRIDEQIGRSKEVSMARYRLFEQMNVPEKAIDELKAAALLSPEEYALTGMIAEFYQRHGMPDSASLFYQKIFPEYKADPGVVFSYATFLLRNDKIDSAKALLITVMSNPLIDQVTKSGYFYNILRDEENFKTVAQVIDTVTKTFLKNHENDVRSLSIYADVFLRLKKYNEASWALTKIVAYDNSNYPAIEQLIYVLNILGKSDSVLLYTTKAMRLQPEKEILYLFSGSAYYQKKDFPLAIKDLNKGLSMTSDNRIKIEFYSLLAECYQETGKYDESEAAFKSALQIDSKNNAIKNNYAYYLSLREKDLKEAERLSKSTIVAEPENSTYLDTYAWVLYKSGKVGQAKKYILKAINNGGEDNEEIVSHCAEILIELKEYGEAVKYLKKILSSPDKVQAGNAQNRIKEIESIMKR